MRLFSILFSIALAWAIPPNTYYFYHDYYAKKLSVYRMSTVGQYPERLYSVAFDSPQVHDLVTIEQPGAAPAFFMLQPYGDLYRIDSKGVSKLDFPSILAIAEHPDGIVAADAKGDLHFINREGVRTRTVASGKRILKFKMVAPDTYVAALSGNRLVVFEQTGKGEPKILSERSYADQLYSPDNTKFILDLVATKDVAWLGVKEFQGYSTELRVLRVDLKNPSAPVAFDSSYEPFLDIDPKTGDLFKIRYDRGYERVSLAPANQLLHEALNADVFSTIRTVGKEENTIDRHFVSRCGELLTGDIFSKGPW